MFTLKIENTRGEIFELTNNEQDYAIVGVSGLTRPDTTVNTSSGVSDGEYYNSSKVGMRNIVIDILLRGDIETNRQRLYRIFPLKTACTVYFKNYNRDVKIKGYVEVLDGDLFVEQEQIQISIICPQPYFESLQTIHTEL
ncbi:MAG: phage tail family protein, partial [Oscillospiraceae bacterium]|nr:phage tail family protein [Oscillospiraceae bacterium]